MGTSRADREVFIPTARNQNRFIADMAEQIPVIGQDADEDSLRQVGPGRG